VESILQPIADYYSEIISTHGPNAAGVDWNGAEGQRLRFKTLLNVLEPGNSRVSIDDYGCGYGALLDFMEGTGLDVDYLGFDISSGMIEMARATYPASAARFRNTAKSPRYADYAVASGIFNVALTTPRAEWEAHVLHVIEEMNRASKKGFAFNCLTSYSDLLRRKDTLYYGDPCFYFDLCKQRYSTNVALLHDYNLFEFSIVVRKYGSL
jgi:SAM-dependent methyltransferase